ncbi:MAG: hypothetical protein IPI30_21220 [Saprospiraceae bacterium]|nr:hypothetical protein [Candidatus Vicinibacter affinis]
MQTSTPYDRKVFNFKRNVHSGSPYHMIVEVCNLDTIRSKVFNFRLNYKFIIELEKVQKPINYRDLFGDCPVSRQEERKLFH